MDKIIKLLNDFNELVMFKHSIFSLPFIFIAMVVAANGWLGWSLLFLGTLAALTARNFAMGFNRYLDRDIDALNPRTINRPSVDGRINATQMLVFTLLNGFGFIVVAYFVNTLALYLAVPILLIVGSYSSYRGLSFRIFWACMRGGMRNPLAITANGDPGTPETVGRFLTLPPCLAPRFEMNCVKKQEIFHIFYHKNLK